jgi:hypothetical protein
MEGKGVRNGKRGSKGDGRKEGKGGKEDQRK